MPAPARTSLEAIVAAGRRLLDEDGIDALTMQRVAAAVAVRAPSLYKHVRDRDTLVRLVARDVVDDLGATLRDATTTGDPAHDLAAIAHAFRAWAHAHTGAFTLLFSRMADAWLEPDPDANAIAPLLRTVAALAGEDRALEAARTVVAWASGFIGMELAGAFRLGGDVDEAYAWGVEAITRAVTAPATAG